MRSRSRPRQLYLRLPIGWVALLVAAAFAEGQSGHSQPSQPSQPSSSQFVVTKSPVKDGVRATTDLPIEQHKRNTGGSDGLGLCVYTATWHAAIWQSVSELYGFRDWMKNYPGGSYPQKFEKTLNDYCREKGIPAPSYVQHTGGDADTLTLALKTGRMVCVTYCGVDGPGRYGTEVIGHMVNLVHLDAKCAAIIDNNFPGTWLWMSRTDFLARWRGVKSDGSAYMGVDRWGRRFPIGGGWAIVFLGPPPVPYPDQPSVQYRAGDDAGGDRDRDRDREPVLVGQGRNCPGGVCPLPLPLPQSPANSSGPQPLGTPPSDRHEWGQFDNGTWGWRFKREPAIEPAIVTAPAPANQLAAEDFPKHGVDAAKMNAEMTWKHNGETITKQVFEILALTDDSERWNLTIVGDAGFLRKVRDDVTALPTATRAKLHVQSYAPGDWPTSQFKVNQGVTLRRPAVNRVGGDVGELSVPDYSLTRLQDLLCAHDGPTPRPAPAPLPKPKEPAPVPVIPNVMPGPPQPPVYPDQPKTVIPMWLVLVVGVIVIVIIRK